MIKKYITLVILVTLVSNVMYGQTKKAFMKSADEAYASKNYYGALTWYGDVLEFDEGDPDVIFKYAESARNFQAYDLAATKYKLLVDSLGADLYPEASFRLGEMYQRMGKYEDAKQYYNLYISEYSDVDLDRTKSANDAIENVDFAISRMEDVDKSATIMDMTAAVNTPYSEFGALKRDDVLYFTTMRYAEENSENIPPRGISKIHTVTDDIDAKIEGDLNDSDLLIAHTTFSTSGSVMYYTICEYINDEEIRCDMYQRSVNEDGTFGDKMMLPSPINIDSTTSTQPQIAYDSMSMTDVLYFVSDREGGKGMLDIYRSTINSDGTFGAVVNLSEINTASNEASPFMHMRSNTLYFSSDGRQGLGGYDVYSSVRSAEGFLTPTHMRLPINSSYHDLYYTYDEVENEAFFSSNREGAMFLDPAKKACCFDIFNVKYDEIIIDLNALVFDELTGESLEGATVTLIDAETGQIIKGLTNEDGNDFFFKVARDKDYKIVVERPFYNSKTIDLSTRDITSSTVIEKKIYLKTDRMQLKVETFNRRTKEELAGVTIRLKNLTTGQVDTITTNELNNKFHFYPKLGYKYEIEASKFGFVTETEIVDLTDISEPGLIEKKMYLEVFDIEDYMPVTVYFENDRPNPRSKSTDTDKVYGDLFTRYMNEKSDYMNNLRKRTKAGNRESELAKFESFFEGDVAGGYDKLKRFMRALKKELALGRNLEIAVKGYASPVADTKYNLALGQRRVASIENEILRYEGGIFREFVENGRLIITDISFGEETSPSSVSDKASDRASSVYGAAAGRERRVQIVNITDQ